MIINKTNTIIFLTGLIVLMWLNINVRQPDDSMDRYERYTVASKKSFDDVMFDLKAAIRQYNYRITSINRIGEAIFDMDEDQNKEFNQVNVVSFCNISIAKKFIETSNRYILYMPCRVVVYEQEDMVIIETYLFTKKDWLHDKVNTMLRNIVDDSAL